VWMPPQEKGSFLGEGDTPTFMNFLDNGLRAYENRRWSGWGGTSRSLKVPTLGLGTAQFTPTSPDDPGLALGLGSASDPTAPAATGAPSDSSLPPLSPANAAANARFFAAAQNDFAARLKWSVTPKFSGVNHEPQVAIKGPSQISARPGATLHLSAEVSDPDHNTVQVTWWQDHAAGTYSGDILFSNPSALPTTLAAPNDAQPGDTVHIILEATDNGAPPLTRYRRLIIRIQ